MSFPISAALLDAIVLSVVAQEPEGTYGYKMCIRDMHGVVEYQTAGVADLSNDKNDQKGQPCARHTHGAAANDAHKKACLLYTST